MVEYKYVKIKKDSCVKMVGNAAGIYVHKHTKL
jgi:hypothetical protein